MLLPDTELPSGESEPWSTIPSDQFPTYWPSLQVHVPAPMFEFEAVPSDLKEMTAVVPAEENLHVPTILAQTFDLPAAGAEADL